MASTTSGDEDEAAGHGACFDAHDAADEPIDATQPTSSTDNQQHQSSGSSRRQSSSTEDAGSLNSGECSAEHKTGITVIDPEGADLVAIEYVPRFDLQHSSEM